MAREASAELAASCLSLVACAAHCPVDSSWDKVTRIRVFRVGKHAFYWEVKIGPGFYHQKSQYGASRQYPCGTGHSLIVTMAYNSVGLLCAGHGAEDLMY